MNQQSINDTILVLQKYPQIVFIPRSSSIERPLCASHSKVGTFNTNTAKRTHGVLVQVLVQVHVQVQVQHLALGLVLRF